MLAQSEFKVNLGEGVNLVVSNRGIAQKEDGHVSRTVADLDQAILAAKALLAICEPHAIVGDVLEQIEEMFEEQQEAARQQERVEHLAYLEDDAKFEGWFCGWGIADEDLTVEQRIDLLEAGARSRWNSWIEYGVSQSDFI